jgi:hypothetical protein
MPEPTSAYHHRRSGRETASTIPGVLLMYYLANTPPRFSCVGFHLVWHESCSS